ncbi:DNA cytosine methyltransferase [Mycolicibacterium austroafricanum]|uniref:DNA cytosine methyltransferase n=1 Tax=Mycolicibacterium austroafricanum TaxID=39687 RepID=UPI001ABFCA43|nr:DNA cytosine methyltransferase [Mycolicibacterium austroafricanum]
MLGHRYPGVPNFRDLARIDWAALKPGDMLEPVDILCGGYPCQPFSHAGKRKGTTDERHIWPHIREAIRRIRPRYTFLENVAGHRSLGFDRVLGDLAEASRCCCRCPPTHRRDRLCAARRGDRIRPA